MNFCISYCKFCFLIRRSIRYKLQDQVTMRLVNDISRVLKKLLKYFNGTIVITFFVPLFPIEPVFFCLNLNEALLPGTLSRVPSSVKAVSFL